MKALAITLLLATALPLAAAPLTPGAWAFQLQYSPDGKRWPPPEPAKVDCVLPEQASKVNSHVRRGLQLFGCRLQRVQTADGTGEGLADCWPQRQVVDFRFRVTQGAETMQLDLQSQPGSAQTLVARLVAQRTRACTAQEARVTQTRLALEAEDGGSGAY